jgi:hypothetical protein
MFHSLAKSVLIEALMQCNAQTKPRQKLFDFPLKDTFSSPNKQTSLGKLLIVVLLFPAGVRRVVKSRNINIVEKAMFVFPRFLRN